MGTKFQFGKTKKVLERDDGRGMHNIIKMLVKWTLKNN